MSYRCRLYYPCCVDNIARDSYEELVDFISIVSGVSNPLTLGTTASNQNVNHFIIHARKCWTCGVNTRENRRIPPLQYDWIFRLLDDFPSIDFTLNGGIKSFAEANELLNRESYSFTQFIIRPNLHRKLRGIMIGRMAMQNSWLFRHADELFYHRSGPHLTRSQVVENYINYVERMQKTHCMREESHQF